MFSSLSKPEIMDRFLQATAIGVFIMSLAFGTSAAKHLVEPGMADTLNLIESVLAIAAMVVVLPPFVLIFYRLSRSERRQCLQPQGYVADIFNRACVKAFELTFLMLVALNVITQDYFKSLPTEFFIQLLLSLSLAVLSLSFYWFNRADADDHVEMEAAA